MLKTFYLLAAMSGLIATPLFAGDHLASYSSMIIRKYDTNDDGKLNADEYPRKYRRYFGKSDGNQDGYVDASELSTQLNEMRSQWRERMKEKAQEYRNRKLQQLVDRAFAGDANADGRLNADEASAVIKKAFAEVDGDDDGYLSRAEVERAFGLAPQAEKNIVETAAGAGSFQTLLKAAVAAGLDEALQREGPFTVFAPTDEAFAKISPATLNRLLADKEELKAVLLYHVVAGKVVAKDVVELKSAKTLQGQSVNISVSDEGVQIDGANVVQTDIACSNGVIHVIDSVLVPELTDSASAPESGSEDRLLSLHPDDFKKTWVTVNDGVMGGVSKGSVRLTADQTLEFFGNLSLQNNGGFASVRSMPQQLGLEEGDTLVARVRGDGREYYLNLYEPSYRIAFSYRAPIKTEDGKWTEVRVPLNDFYATSFGRPVNNARLNPSKVNSIGFLLSDNQAGPFRLEVKSIRVVKSGESS